MHDHVSKTAEGFRLLTDEDSVRDALNLLHTQSIVGLDTETYWDRETRRSCVSLVQLAAPEGEAIVVDALALGLELLRPLVEDPAVLMAAHNARFDEGVLAGAGLQPVGFVDTLRLARLALSLESYSLASVSQHLFGIALDKTLQTSNWRRRPLTKAQLSYAATDARITLQVYESLTAILKNEGRLEEALRRSTLTPLVPRTAGEGGRERRRRRVAPQVPSEPLTEKQKSIVAHLRRWRMRYSNLQRVPAYMVCPDKTLEHLARTQPVRLEELSAIYGLGESKIARFGEELLEALQEALA